MDINECIKILLDIKSKLYCPMCRKKYLPKDIILKGFFENSFVLQATCINNHSAILTVIKSKEIKDKNNKNSFIQPISESEGKLFKEALENFNGNFKSIFEN